MAAAPPPIGSFVSDGYSPAPRSSSSSASSSASSSSSSSTLGAHALLLQGSAARRRPDTDADEPPPPLPHERPAPGCVRILCTVGAPLLERELLIVRRHIERMSAEIAATVLAPLNGKSFPVSMRTIDYFIMVYAVEERTCCPLPGGEPGETFKVHESYLEFVRTLRKNGFDIFKRVHNRDRAVWLDYDGARELVRTTLAQCMLLMEWLLPYGVLEYIVTHAEEIHAHEGARRRRRRAALECTKR